MNLNLNFDGDTKLKDWWKTVKSNFQNIKSDFENEVSTRANADSELRNIIDAETAARTNVDDKLNSAISSEINSRKTADNELSSAIYDEKVEHSREITRIENIVYSESEQFSDLLSGLYFYEKSIKLSECASEAYGWHTLAEEVPENVLFFVENDTDTAISEFREYDSAAIKLGTPIDAGETRLCVLTKRETVGVDSSKDGYIFVLDEGVLSKAATEALAEKQDKVTGGASTIVSSNLTANRAVVSDSSGKVSVSAVTSTELGYLDGVTSNVQTQLDSKQDSISATADRVMICNANGEITSSPNITTTNLSTLSDMTSNIKTQLDSKAPKNHASTATTYGTGTASSYGHLKLSNSVSSTSSTSSGVAATPYAVKQAYDLANTANTAAGNAQDDIDGVNEAIAKIPIEKAVYSSTTSNVPSGYTAPVSTGDFPAPADGVDIELMRGIYNISSVVSNSTAGVYRYVGQGACDIAANLPTDSQYKSMTTVKIGAALSGYALNFTARAHCRFENITFVIDKTSNFEYGLLKTTSAGACVEFINCAFVFNTSRLFYFTNGNARFTNCDFYCTASSSRECVHIIEQYNSGRVIVSNCKGGNYGDVGKCYLNNMTHYGSYGLSNSTLIKINPVRIDTSAAVGEKVRIVGNLIESASIGHDTTAKLDAVNGSSLTIADNNITGSEQMFISMPAVSCTLCGNSFGIETPVTINCCGQYTTISANSGGKVVLGNFRGNTAVTGNSFVSYSQAVNAGNILKTGNLPTT